MDHYTTDNFTLTESIGFALNKARNLLVMEMDAALDELDISGPQRGVLMMLKESNAHTPFELSRALGIDSGLMTRMLDKLESRGLLARVRSVEDRRVVLLSLTAQGHDLASRIPDIVPGVLNRRVGSFSESEFAELNALLAKFLND
jgi:DNA-binding MarR family transcriptional regulator